MGTGPAPALPSLCGTGVSPTSLQHGPLPGQQPLFTQAAPQHPAQQDFRVSPNGPSTATASGVGERNRLSLVFSWPAEII